MKLREIPSSDVQQSLQNGEIVPFHGNHFLMGNSGFENNADWEESLDYTEAFAKFLWERGNSHQGDIVQFSTSVLEFCKRNHHFLIPNKTLASEITRFEEFFKTQRYQKPNAVHGGGTLYEYFQQAGKVFSITMHGVRGIERPLITYQGEPFILAPRGKFAVENSHMIRHYLGQHAKKALLTIEKENLGQSPEAKAVYTHYADAENSADIAVFSTHAIDMHGDPKARNIKNLRFIDGSDKHFADILAGHEGSDLADKMLASIITYVRAQTMHVQTLAPQAAQEIKILGHCDLIKLAIHKVVAKTSASEAEKQKFMETLFRNSTVIQAYQQLFQACVAENICVELNISGAAKGVGVYPSKPIAELAVQEGAKLVYATDAHSLAEMHASKTERFQKAFLQAIPEGASIWTV